MKTHRFQQFSTPEGQKYSKKLSQKKLKDVLFLGGELALILGTLYATYQVFEKIIEPLY